MKRENTEIWNDDPETDGNLPEGSAAGWVNAAPHDDGGSFPRKGRKKDTDLRDISETRRQVKRREKKAIQGEPADRSAAPPPFDPDPAPADYAPVEKERRKFSEILVSVLSGNILSRNEVRRAYPYMIFVALLAFFYIGNAFRAQSIYREHAALMEEVKELRAKSMTIASDKMRATRQSRIMKELDSRGIPLKESLVPNKVIPKPKRNGEEEIYR